MNFVHPWEEDKILLSKATLENIKNQLFLLKIPYLKTPPPKKIVTVINFLLNKLHEAQENDEIPWFLLLSSNPVFLHTCAISLLGSFAVNTAMSVFISDVESLAKVFMTKKPVNDFEIDVAGETIHKAKKAGLLVIENLSEHSVFSIKAASSFTSFFTFRAINKLPTIFTVYGENKTKKTITNIMLNIEKNIGTVAKKIIEDAVEILIFNYSSEKKSRITEIKI